MSEDKLTVADMRNVSKAYDRGVKHTMERLGDGAPMLRKKHEPQEHDAIYTELQKWLSANLSPFHIRAPGVKDNLFRLSDYISGRLGVPPKDVLTFLHAYIFALEGAHAAAQDEIRRLKKESAEWGAFRFRPKKAKRA